METVTIQGVELTLATPDDHESAWVDYHDYARQLEAAWLRLSDVEPPLNPRLIGEPGLGKTTPSLRRGDEEPAIPEGRGRVRHEAQHPSGLGAGCSRNEDLIDAVDPVDQAMGPILHR